MSIDEAKLLAARAALSELPSEGTLGLGSGSTARLFIDEVGALVAAGRRFRGVPTSQASREQASALGIPLFQDDETWDIAVTVDGADEVDADLNLIKGGGAAHTREKIVNFASRKNVIIVDETKLSGRLGEKWPVPLEVLSFGLRQTLQHLASLGRPVERMKGGRAVTTDSNHRVVDLHVPPLTDPRALELALKAIPGVVETGLFLGRADVVFVAGKTGVQKLQRRKD